MAEKKPLRPRYSGVLSGAFWDRVNALPHRTGDAVYSLGVALQNLEGQVLTTLRNAEVREFGKAEKKR